MADAYKPGKWNAALAQIVILLTGLAMMVYSIGLVEAYGIRLGLPADRRVPFNILELFAGQTFFTLFHELGHWLAAWAQNFRFQAMKVGPITLRHDAAGRRRIEFHWAGLVLGNGYLASVPATATDLRWNWIVIAGAGPLASLLLGLSFLLCMLMLPGSAWQNSWPYFAFAAAICLSDSVANLIPLGQSDGSQILHTLLPTAKGERILAALESMMHRTEAEMSGLARDFEKETMARRHTVARLDLAGEGESMHMAVELIELGRALVRVREFDEAIERVERALAILGTRKPANTVLETYIWTLLEEAHRGGGRHGKAGFARDKAMKLLERVRHEAQNWEELVPVLVAGVKLLLVDHAVAEALELIDDSLLHLPAKSSLQQTRGELLALRAECLFRNGMERPAISALNEGLALLRRDKLQSPDLVGHTASRLYAAGQDHHALALLEWSIEEALRQRRTELASLFRLTRARMLHENLREAEAESELTQATSLPNRLLASANALRAEVLLCQGRAVEAIESLDPQPRSASCEGPEEARFEALLSQALLGAGMIEEAEESAKRSCNYLVPNSSPDAAIGLLVLAVIGWRQHRGGAGAYLDEAYRLILSAEHLSEPAKARQLDRISRDLAAVSRSVESSHAAGKAYEIRRSMNMPLLTSPMQPQP